MSHGQAKLLLAGVLLALLGPLLVRGHVIFPHDNGAEVGLAGEPAGKWNRKFADQSSVYVPAIHQHLNGDHAGWISTWNPHSELGRPTFQLAGESKAFFLTHVLSWLTHDAFRLYTWQTVIAIVCAAFFGYLLLAALGLHPAACLVGALGLGCGLFPLYWMTFVLFIWGIAWTLAILWLIERTLRRPSAPGVLGLAIATQSLLLTAYPQTIVWHVYLTIVFVIWRWRVHRAARGTNVTGLLALAVAAVLGALAAAPVYLDLAENASRSARLAAETEFFLQVLPPLESWGDWCAFWLLRFDASFLGDPIRPDFPLRFNGLSATPLYFALMVASLVLVRRLWAAQLFVLVCVVMTLWPAAYAFGIEHLGLHVSRTIPLSAAYLPAFLLAAFAADRWIVEHRGLRGGSLVLLALASAAVVLFAFGTPAPLSSGLVVVGALLWLGAIAFFRSGSPLLLVLLALATTLHHGWRLQLTRPRDEIHTSSPLTQLVQHETKNGARFAWVEGGLGFPLPSNQETLLGLRSIHTYNSISSRSYQDFAARLSTRGTQTYGRHFTHIASPGLIDPVALSRAGVTLLLSTRPLPEEIARPLSPGATGGGAWRSHLAPLHQAQLPAARCARAADGGLLLPPDLRSSPLACSRTDEQDDRLVFRVTAMQEESLLFVSQQYHPRWTASAAEKVLETVAVDGFYQGVLLPPGTDEVELVFLPRVRHAWIPQAIGALVAGVLALRALLGRRSALPPA